MKVRIVSGLVGLTAALVLAAPGTAVAQAPANKPPAAPGAKPAGKPDPKKAAEEARKAEEAKKAEEARAAEEAKKAEEEKAAADKKAEEDAAAEAAKKKETTEPPAEEWDVKDVFEKPGKTYLFVGLRYRGTIVPKAFQNIFVDGGATIYGNQVGVELDIRKDGFSLIPAISFAEYGTGNILFKEKNSKDIPGNYNMINSGIGAVYLSVDLLWSAKISKMFDFEYGLGVGLGFIFGNLVTNWVTPTDPNRPVSENNYTPCITTGPPGCNAADHQNSEVNRVNGYTEPSWFNGGSKPSLFPWISFPQVGLRIKPVKMFEGRLGLGFGLTGIWFGLSGNYGLERKPQ